MESAADADPAETEDASAMAIEDDDDDDDDLDHAWLSPVVGRITTRFGAQDNGSFHDAIDIAVPVGTEVIAPVAMHISYVGFTTTAGRFV